MVRNQEIKSFNDLIKETAAELEGKIDYGSLMFVTARERLCNFNKYRQPSILFDNIRKEKIKLPKEAWDL